MTNRALIGHTGFVGSNLAKQIPFDAFFNSTNCDEIRGKHFDEIYCAGISAVKWKANKDPEGDWGAIAPLLKNLEQVTADRFVLISTVDCYANPHKVDESTPIDESKLHPYGLHRYRVEQFVGQRFPKVNVIRLPGLFGPGLKKNAIYDFIHNNNVGAIDSQAIFQFYDLRRLSSDIATAIAHDLPLVNFSTAPTAVRDIAKKVFDMEFDNKLSASPPDYDMRSLHAAAFGGQGAYLMSAEQVFSALRNFVEEEKTACLPK